MASSFTRSFFFFFFITTFLLSTKIHARESYFFHKLQRDNAHDKNPSFVPPETNQKSSGEVVLPENEQEQQGYSLYGHETTYNNDNNNEEFDNQYEGNDNYKYSKDDDKNYYDNNNYNSNVYGRERSSSEYRGYSSQRQGMSDTRFMENSKYYYDVNDGNNHGESYKKNYRQNPSYAVSNYDRLGQNNNGGGFHNNNNNNELNSFQDPYNSKWEKNMMMMNEQEKEDKEFGEEQQDQFVP